MKRPRPDAVRVGIGSLLLALGLAVGAASWAQDDATLERAIQTSQAALGNSLGELELTDGHGRPRRLSGFAGKPLVVSLVFSGCAYACSVTTRYLDRVVREARAALGQTSFTVLTIGFDTPVDSPEAMHAFARRHGITDPDWHFLSGDDPAAMAALMERLGVLSLPSPRGFDHTVQASVFDRDGILYRQVYGEVFATPLLVEPLKDLVLGRPPSDAGFWARLESRVRLFCTVYDPASDRYYFDYSLFVGIAIGALFLGAVALWWLREARSRRRSQPA